MDNLKLKYVFILVAAISCITVTASAAEIKIALKFPSEGSAKMLPPGKIDKPTTVTGALSLDIAPYPASFEPRRYLVEYFIDNKLLFSTDGGEGTPSFVYTMDSTKFTDGEYKIIVNFWDKQGQSAIGAKKINIKNDNIEE